MSNEEHPTRVERTVHRLRDNSIIAPVIVIGLVVIAIGNFTTAVDRIKDFLWKSAIVKVRPDNSQPPKDVTVAFDKESPATLDGNYIAITASVKDENGNTIQDPVTWQLINATDSAYVDLFQEGNTIKITRKPAADTEADSNEGLPIPLQVVADQSKFKLVNNSFNLIVKKARSSSHLNTDFLSIAANISSIPEGFLASTQDAPDTGWYTSHFASLQKSGVREEPQVYIIDNRFRVYNKTHDPNRETNATDIYEIIKVLPVHSDDENITVGWEREKEIVKADLIIIHQRAFLFSDEDYRGDWDGALRQFIGNLAKRLPNVQFLVYSRDVAIVDRYPDGEKAFVLAVRFERELKRSGLNLPGLKHRIHPFHVRPVPNAFSDQATRLRLIDEVKRILKLP